MKIYGMTEKINLIVRSMDCVTKSGFDGYMVSSDDLQSPETVVELLFTELNEEIMGEIRSAFSDVFAGVFARNLSMLGLIASTLSVYLPLSYLPRRRLHE